MREEHHAQVFRLLAQDIAGFHTSSNGSPTISPNSTSSFRRRSASAGKNSATVIHNRHNHQSSRSSPMASLAARNSATDPTSTSSYCMTTRNPASANSMSPRPAHEHLMSSQTPAGQLFDVDYRLRPNGDSGMLVNSLDAFRSYLLGKAWVFEHQALTRARFCAGDPEPGARFESLRIEILRQPRDLPKLREDVLAMRQRMLDAHATNSVRGKSRHQARPGRPR